MLDSYPMWPCGNISTSYKALPSNWPSSHWAWYDSRSSQASGTTPGRVIYRVCMGCIQCTNPSCNVLIRPQVRQSGKGIAKQLEQKCPLNCGYALSLTKCSAKLYLTTFTQPNANSDLAIMVHKGELKLPETAQPRQTSFKKDWIYVLEHHHHPRPPVHKPSPDQLMKFAERIKAAPDTRPLKLKIGQSLNPEHQLAPVRTISQALNNLDRITYYRRRILSEPDITGKLSRQHTDDFVHQFGQFQWDHPDFVQYTNFTGKVVVIMQTPWMKAQLKELIRDDGSKNLGTLTDTTYNFFKSGFLLTSTIYSSVLQRWIPIQVSFVGREDEDHIFQHFQFLIERLQEVIPPEKLAGAFDEVVDFSSAQHNAFRRAFVNVMMKPKLIMDACMSDQVKAMFENQFDIEAKTHLKGCLQHYRYAYSFDPLNTK
jgi:hypothetical protein